MRTLLLIALSLIAIWLALLVALIFTVRGRSSVRTAARLLPDTLRLVRRLATDPTIPRSARVPVWLLIAYLASPIDLVPDFVPLIGHADDLILIGLVLRHLLHRAGPDKLDEHWSGSPEGLAALRKALSLQDSN